MHLLHNIFMVSPFFLLLTSAVPTQHENRAEGTRRVQLQAAGKEPLAPVAYARALAKYGLKVPEHVKRSAEAAAPGTGHDVVDSEYWDDFYTGNVTVGKQTFQMEFHTANAATWVFSTLLPQKQRGTHKLYTLGGTPHPIEDGKPVMTFEAYTSADEDVKGQIYGDTVSVGTVSADMQPVGAASFVSPFYTTLAMDGQLGLGRDVGWDCTPHGDHTCIPWFSNKVDSSQWHVAQKVFTASLKTRAPGSWDFGFIDKTKYTGPIQYRQLNFDFTRFPGTWSFDTPGYALNKGAITHLDNWWDTVMDSGIGINLIPTSVIQKIYAKVTDAQLESSSGLWMFPCANVNQIPSFDLDLKNWMTKPNQLTSMPGNPFGIYGPHPSIQGYCYGSHQDSGDETLAILGTAFMKSQFVIFDYYASEVGFAKQK